MPTHPEVLWAQRSSDTDDEKNIVFLTVNLPDIQENTLRYDLQPTKITLEAKAGNASKNIEERDYAFTIDFFAEIDPEKSTTRLTSRSFNLIIRKKEKKLEYWPRLTKEKVKTPFVKTDFSKWVDEDEQDGAIKDLDDDFDGMGAGLGGSMDFQRMMANMGKGDAPDISAGANDDSSDSEDDGPPPLEDVTQSEQEGTK
ncbi:hypothetical protein AMATHDRAFT_72472 [Amanita thiersii Skay4041]|uniref:CS domain-containing protein n=1 Tax=Amanita thiersii Skay4041 TaxID=703135 RepID=A0A2A9P1U5_9AGAR|nr:hypothetical protein AMATHDRAFT_72472 [Amanita thiersii Skay4041]